MKSKARSKGSTTSGGVGGGSSGGIVIEATNRKARRKEQRHAAKKKKQHQITKRKLHVIEPTSTSSSSVGAHNNNGSSIAVKKQKVDDNNNRVKFSNTIQEKIIPSVKNHIPVGLKKKKNKKKSEEEYDDASSYYENLDDETATALHADDVEISYLERELGIKRSNNKKSSSKELNREYAKNEGFGNDFGDFLMGLDRMVENCVGGDDDGDDSDSDRDSESDSEDVNGMKGMDSKEDDSSSNNASDTEEEGDDDDDTYADLDEEMALALRKDDAEIVELEAKLLGSSGNNNSSSKKAKKKKLNKEFASTFMGYGEDFGDFLDGLDELGERGSSKKYEAVDSDDDDSDDDQRKNDDGGSSNSKEDVGARSNSDDDGSASEAEKDDEDNEPTDTPDHDVSLTYRPTLGEDIYGNKIDASQNDDKKPSKYIPPHLRKKLDEDTGVTPTDDGAESSKERTTIAADPETIQHIQRQLNNILNRLSIQTLESVSKSISKLYDTYPFHDVNDCLWKNIQSACIPPYMIMSGLIPLYIGSMAGVHWLGGDGVQFGGSLVEWSVSKLMDSLNRGRGSESAGINNENGQEQKHDMINKEASNVLLIACYLYNYGVIHCSLIYDLIRDFIKHFSELDVESLLLTLSHCGQQLRSDDPSALKEIVLLVKDRAQKIASEDDSADGQNVADSSRIEYMVDTIIELKNNKPRKQDAVLRDKSNAIKKCIGRVKTSASHSLAGKKSGSCLRVTLQDILDAETKGRWWMVGASWAGNGHCEKLWGDGEAGYSDDYGAVNTSDKSSKEAPKEDSLLALASSQRMNTDARRSIFCIIMGSSDCNHAFEKLVRAGMLKPKAERDVIRVIVQCCGEEKAYNPYYSYLAMRCCEYQGKSRFTLMLTFWDAFKMIDTYSLRKVANLAKLLAHLVGANNKCLTIGVLKRIEFSPSDMSEMITVFLSIFMTTLFESCDVIGDINQIFGYDISSSSTAPVTKKRRRDVDPFDDSEDEDETDNDKKQTTKKEDLSDLRESLSIFMLQYLKQSPNNVEGSVFNANLMAAIAACEQSSGAA